MPWFIKTEKFTLKTSKLSNEKRQRYLQAHCNWVMNLKQSGMKIASGYLVDNNRLPGGGGLLIIEAYSFEAAKSLIIKDPMIVANLVIWNLQEWIPVCGDILS